MRWNWKTLVGILYLLIGIGVPLYFALNPAKPVLSTDETILVLAVFVLAVTAGAVFIVTSLNSSVPQPSSPKQQVAPSLPKPVARPVVTKVVPRPITRPILASPRPPAERSVHKPAMPVVTSFALAQDKPDINKLMEDLKNYIKLESWSLALQKANEIIHYYPDAPETETVRDNLSFLSQKVRENR